VNRVGAYSIAILAGYLLGSIPVAVLVGRRFAVDPRTAGDRNPGYWNVKGLLGFRAALPVFVGDSVKGALAGLAGVASAHAFGCGRPVVYAAVAAAMIGHAWPVFARFTGGRSILTFAGGMAVISPVAFGLCVALCAAVAVGTWNFAYGARLGVFAAPVAVGLVAGWRWAAATFALMSIIGLRFLLAARAARAGRRRSGPASSGSDGESPG
jgi:acyl phosphate:glycerol-3-phosphate acyltransferase